MYFVYHIYISKTMCEIGIFSTGPEGSALNNLMNISLVLVIFPLARLNFNWPRVLGQLLRLQTAKMYVLCLEEQGVTLNDNLITKVYSTVALFKVYPLGSMFQNIYF